MTTDPSKPDSNAELQTELRGLHDELRRLNKHRFVRIHNSMWKLIVFQIVRGLAFGLGSVVGATILVSFLAYSLSNIDFIPIVGEWAKEIANMITHNGTGN